MAKSKLKPCPLCGDERPAFNPANPPIHGYTITCYECGLVLYGNHREARAKLVARWNRRIDKTRED